MPRLRFGFVSLVAVLTAALAGGWVGSRAATTGDRLEEYRAFTAALGAIDQDLRREGRVGHARLQRHRRDAADARPAFELHGSAHLRAAARAAGGALLRPRHLDRRHRRRHHRDVALRGVPGLPQGHPAGRRHRADRRGERQGLDIRPGRQAAARREGDDGPHLAPAPGLRAVHRTRRASRRDQHAVDPGRVHGRADHRLHPAPGLHRDDGPRARTGGQGADGQGDEAAGARPARQSRRSARTGDQRRQRLPPAGAADRLHARPRAQLGSGLSSPPRRASTPASRWSSW